MPFVVVSELFLTETAVAGDAGAAGQGRVRESRHDAQSRRRPVAGRTRHWRRPRRALGSRNAAAASPLSFDVDCRRAEALAPQRDRARRARRARISASATHASRAATQPAQRQAENVRRYADSLRRRHVAARSDHGAAARRGVLAAARRSSGMTVPLWLIVLVKSAILLLRRRHDVRVHDARRAQSLGLDATASGPQPGRSVGLDAAGRRRGEADAQGRSHAQDAPIR